MQRGRHTTLSPDAVQRDSGAPLIRGLRRRGARLPGVCYDPGSAAHHCVLRCARDTRLGRWVDVVTACDAAHNAAPTFAMVALRKEKMTVNEFLPWAKQQPERWELFDGVAVAMSPERVIHGDTKYRAARAFDNAIASARVPCRFVLDSAAVRIDTRNSYQPDVLVYCGASVAQDAVEVPNPVIVVEVLSPGNAITDLRDKLQGYFRVASVQHYLVIDPDQRLVIHHTRGHGDVVGTRIVPSGQITLNPPRLSLPVVDFFGPAPA